MEKHARANSLKDDRYELFCQEYLKDLNITQSALRAGFSVKSAKQYGSKVFYRPEVQERIEYLFPARTNVWKLMQIMF